MDPATLFAIEELARANAPASTLGELLGAIARGVETRRDAPGKLRAYFYLYRARARVEGSDEAEDARAALRDCAAAVFGDDDDDEGLIDDEGEAFDKYVSCCERAIAIAKGERAKEGRDDGGADVGAALREELLGVHGKPSEGAGTKTWTKKHSKELMECVEALLDEIRRKTTSLMIVQENVATSYYRPAHAPQLTPRSLGKENARAVSPRRDWVDVGKKVAPSPAKTPPRKLTRSKSPESTVKVYVSPARRLLGSVASFISRSLSLGRQSTEATTHADDVPQLPMAADEYDDEDDDILPTQVPAARPSPPKSGRGRPKVVVPPPVPSPKKSPEKRSSRSGKRTLEEPTSDDDYEDLDVTATQVAELPQSPRPSAPKSPPKKQKTSTNATATSSMPKSSQPAKKRLRSVPVEDDIEDVEVPTAPASPALGAARPTSPSRTVVVPRPNYAKVRRRKTKFTPEEVAALRQGVKVYGKGAWAKILQAHHAVFDTQKRTQVDLKDKWRNIENKEAKAVMIALANSAARA